jgi:hypothetical protein
MFVFLICEIQKINILQLIYEQKKTIITIHFHPKNEVKGS